MHPRKTYAKANQLIEFNRSLILFAATTPFASKA